MAAAELTADVAHECAVLEEKREEKSDATGTEG
jgi:hypothetical protein